MESFLNSQALKNKITARVQLHQNQDEIVQGTYWENGKGCLWGCSLESKNPHSIVEAELGIPRIISRLSDKIFEGLPNAEAKLFPLQFHQALPVGVDLHSVWDKFAYWLMDEIKYFAKGKKTITTINCVQQLYAARLKGENPSVEEWENAADAAAHAAYDAAAAAAVYDAAAAAVYDAAAHAAHAAHAADAAYDAAAAVYDAAAAVYDAAYYAAAADAAADAARSRFYSKMRDKLLMLLRQSDRL